jgi:two-component system chemotaxis sensor kinase CheA
MIEDPELRSLFKTESEEHLRLLEEGLLRLEGNPTDGKTLEEVFRGAHSLKGGAAMLGLRSIERLAHGFEDVLNAARQGKVVLSSGEIDRLCKQLDTMREFVAEAVSDPPGDATAARALMPIGGDDSTGPPARAVPALFAEDGLERAGDAPEVDGVQAPTVSLEASSGRYRIDTMRVEPQKLDALMKQANELMVAKIHIARRLTQIEALITLCEEWSREIFAAHHAVHADQNGGGPHAGPQRVAAWLQRDRERIDRLGTLVNDLRTAAYEDSDRLDSVVTALEESIRNVRLLPLGTIFQLFPRMVRDLARDQAKEVRLIVEGGDTTADKRILEEMKDPLMHMLRNAIDHGLETPEERQRCGKPRLGTIHLRARLTSSNLVIEVADDGRGLDLGAIKRTALKRRLRARKSSQP